MDTNQDVTIKVDFKNAFNSTSWAAILEAVNSRAPALLPLPGGQSSTNTCPWRPRGGGTPPFASGH
jgi:hypothetical protein